MNPLRTHLGSLSKDEREALAKAVDTSVAYLWQIAYEQRRCSESMAISIDKATRRAVRMEGMRSDVDWSYVRESAETIADQLPVPLVKVASIDDAQPPTGGEIDDDTPK